MQTFRHWGIYTADDAVLHLTQNSSSQVVIELQSLKEASLDGYCELIYKLL